MMTYIMNSSEFVFSMSEMAPFSELAITSLVEVPAARCFIL